MEVYNKDEPVGETLITSELIVPKYVKTPSGSSKFISIQNKNGTTGSFISTITLSGDAKDNYKIKSKSTHFLVDADEQFEIMIKHLGNATN